MKKNINKHIIQLNIHTIFRGKTMTLSRLGEFEKMCEDGIHKYYLDDSGKPQRRAFLGIIWQYILNVIGANSNEARTQAIANQWLAELRNNKNLSMQVQGEGARLIYLGAARALSLPSFGDFAKTILNSMTGNAITDSVSAKLAPGRQQVSP